MEQILSRIETNKDILIFISILGLVSSIYGYYQILSTVQAFSDIFGAFEANLSAASQFIIKTHNYYGLLSILGLLALILSLFNKINPLKAYILVASNFLFMLGVRWLTANELNQSLLSMGIIQ